VYKILVGRPVGKRLRRRSRRRWENNITTDFKKYVLCEVVDWNHLADDAVQ